MTSSNTPPFADLKINFAVYGGPGWGGGAYQVADISGRLQELISQALLGENNRRNKLLIAFNNQNFGDFSPNVPKGFGVSITINGTEYLYAGQEGDTVDFSRPPINPLDMNFLLLRDLGVTVNENGWPPAGVPNLFTSAAFTIQNSSVTLYPPNAVTSQWVSVDFYASRSNSPTQPVDDLFWIGDQGINVGTLPPLHGVVKANVAAYPNGLWDIGRGWTGNPLLAPGGDYYIYAQVRDPMDRVMLSNGCFSTASVRILPPQ